MKKCKQSKGKYKIHSLRSKGSLESVTELTPVVKIKAMGHLLRKTAGCRSSLRECAAVSKTEWRWKPEEECFDIRHGDAEFGVRPAASRSCFALVFPHHAPIPPFLEGMSILCHCMLEMYDLLFDFALYRGLQ